MRCCYRRRPAGGGGQDFAGRYGYKKWTVSLEEALADPPSTS